MTRRTVRTLVALVAALAAITVALTACGDDGSSATDASTEQLAESWWRWVAGTAPVEDPLADTDGHNCDVNQTDEHVWFLANTQAESVTRTCRVPHGRTLFVPIVNNLCNVEDAGGCVLDPLTDQEATLDGKALPVERVAVRKPFTMGVKQGNELAPDGGMVKITTDGYWVRIPPPSVGVHVLELVGSSALYTVHVTYHLDVVHESYD